MGPSRSGIDAQGVVDGLLWGFGAGGFAHVQGGAVVAPEGGGDALLAFEDSPQRGPTGALAGLAQAPANDLDELIGDEGEEQMAFGADGLVVVDGAQAELGLQRAEHGLDVGECEVGAPQGGFVALGVIAAQAVHAGVGQQGAWERAAGEAHGSGAFAGLVAYSGAK